MEQPFIDHLDLIYSMLQISKSVLKNIIVSLLIYIKMLQTIVTALLLLLILQVLNIIAQYTFISRNCFVFFFLCSLIFLLTSCLALEKVQTENLP